MKGTGWTRNFLIWILAITMIFGIVSYPSFAGTTEQITLTITSDDNGELDGGPTSIIVDKGTTWANVKAQLPTTTPKEGYYFSYWSGYGVDRFSIWDEEALNRDTTIQAIHVIPHTWEAYKNVSFSRTINPKSLKSGLHPDVTGFTEWESIKSYGFDDVQRVFSEERVPPKNFPDTASITISGKPIKTGLTEPAAYTVLDGAGNMMVNLIRFDIRNSVIENPDAIPDGFVKVVFHANHKGKLNSSVSELKDQEELSYAVHQDMLWEDFKGNVPEVVPTAPYQVEASPNTWRTAGGDLLPTDEETVKASTYYAQYRLDPIIPVEPEDNFDAPDNYVTILFDKGDQGEFVTGVITKYYVDPDAGKTLADIPQPGLVVNKGYVFATPLWNPEYKEETPIKDSMTFVAQYDKIPDIIADPEDPTHPITPPDDYVTLIFSPGDHGEFVEKAVKKYYINPTAAMKLADVTKPGVKAHDSYRWTGWNQADSLVITENLTVTAVYEKIPVVIENPGTEQPAEGYVRILFQKGEHGLLDSSMTAELKAQSELVYDVKADQPFSVVPVPFIRAQSEWQAEGWLPQLPAEKDLVQTASYVAQYSKIYNPPLGSITVTKVWKGGPKEKPVVKFQLLQNGVPYGDVVELKDTTEATWKDLPLLDEQGKEPVYTVKEVDVPENYKVSYTTDGQSIINTWVEPETTEGKASLPKTGSQKMIGLLAVGALFLALGIFLNRKQNQDKA